MPFRLIAVFTFAVSVLAASPVGAHESADEHTHEAVTDATHPLIRALALTPDEYADLGDKELFEAADWLWNWSYMGPGALVDGTPAERIAAMRKSNEMLRVVLARDKSNPFVYANIARNNYDVGESLPEDAVAERTALYEEIISLSEACLKAYPENPDCWHWLASGIGRLSTTKGVLSSLFSASRVEEAWLKSVDIQPTTVSINGDPTDNNARYGLGVFYRMVPDSWFVKMLAGVRGSKKKSVEYFRKSVEVQPWRLELQKELAASLLCYALEEDEPEALEEGKRLLREIRAGKFDQQDIRLTDVIDKVHAGDLLAHPDRACGYSRDGYQDVDESKLKEQAEES